MNRRFILCVFLCVLWLVMGCAPTTKVTKTALPPAPSYAEAKHLYEGIDVLAQTLITSIGERRVGKIAVADLIGPGEDITGLGEHLSDKVSIKLFSSGRFPGFMERKQLKQLLTTIKDEKTGYFNPSTVSKFGKMIGADSIVIGTIQDLGNFFDVTAKIVEVENGTVQAMADVRLIKDDTTIRLVNKQRTATLMIAVDPPVSGTVAAGGRQGFLEHGMVTFTGIPYGDCSVVIQPHGYDSINKNIAIRSRAETLTVRLQSKRYEVSFQINPPDASLTVNGQALPLNPQGFAKVSDLDAREYSYMIRAKGYKDRLGTFNPGREQCITLDLQTNDPFYATKNKFFQKVQQVKKQRDFSVKLWTDQSNYRLGDSIYFYFRAERDCYLNLVDIASDGEIRLIFPNRFHSDHYVRGGVTHRIPGENYGFSFEVEPPTGAERVYAIASTLPLNIFAHDFSQEAFVTLTRGKTRGSKVRGIGVKLDRAELSAAAECVLHIR